MINSIHNNPIIGMVREEVIKPIPVTLLSGFLGSGKTTLLEHILTHNHNLRIAVVINDMSLLNIDASLIESHRVSQKEEKLIKLQNGCICCTLRGDLLEELVSLAKNKAYDHIIIESTGISEPMQVAETFTTEFTDVYLANQDDLTPETREILDEISSLGGLARIAKLDSCITVVDAKTFLDNFETTEFLVDRWGSSGQNEEDRTICDLMVDQIEFSNVIIVNKTNLIKRKEKKRIHKIIKMLNPNAKVIATNYAKVDIKEIVGTSLFDFEKVQNSVGWLQSLHEMTKQEKYNNKLTPKPETEEYGINNFVYTSRRPFHPERIYNLLKDKFSIIEQSGFADEEGDAEKTETVQISDDDEDEDEDEDEVDEDVSDAEIVLNRKKTPFGPVLRSKGFFWLASRHIIRGEWSSAGPMLTLRGGLPWFAITGYDEFSSETRKLIKQDMVGEHGDRRNEIVFIGLGINQSKLTKLLDSCLVTDEEFDLYNRITGEKNLFKVEKNLQMHFTDGFESWITFSESSTEG